HLVLRLPPAVTPGCRRRVHRATDPWILVAQATVAARNRQRLPRTANFADLTATSDIKSLSEAAASDLGFLSRAATLHTATRVVKFAVGGHLECPPSWPRRMCALAYSTYIGTDSNDYGLGIE